MARAGENEVKKRIVIAIALSALFALPSAYAQTPDLALDHAEKKRKAERYRCPEATRRDVEVNQKGLNRGGCKHAAGPQKIAPRLDSRHVSYQTSPGSSYGRPV